MYRHIKVSGILISAASVLFNTWSAAQDVKTVDVTKLAKNIVEVWCDGDSRNNFELPVQSNGPCTLVSPIDLSAKTIFTVPEGNAFVITTVDIRVRPSASIRLLQTLPPQQPAQRGNWETPTGTTQLQFRSGIVIPPGAQLSVSASGASFVELSLHGYLTPVTLCDRGPFFC
jgi:hypothetical protein